MPKNLVTSHHVDGGHKEERIVGSQRQSTTTTMTATMPSAASGAATPPPADIAETSATGLNLIKLGCAFKALQCSTRATETAGIDGVDNQSNTSICKVKDGANCDSANDSMRAASKQHSTTPNASSSTSSPSKKTVMVVRRTTDRKNNIRSPCAPAPGTNSKPASASSTSGQSPISVGSITPERQEQMTQFADFANFESFKAEADIIVTPHPQLQQQKDSNVLQSVDSYDSYDSNDTPTTCNGQNHLMNLIKNDNDGNVVVYSPRTVSSRRQQQLQRLQHPTRREDGKVTEEELYNSLPPKQIMQRSLSLGDSLSPTTGHADEDEELNHHDHVVVGNVVDHDNQSCRGAVSASLQLPSISSQRQRGLYASSPVKNKTSADRERISMRSDDGCSSKISTVSSFTCVLTVRDDNDNNNSCDVYSKRNETENSTRRLLSRNSAQQQQLKPLSNNKNDNKRKITPHPFFWRSHPNVTVKSYHFQQQQHRPRIRRIVPKIERVPSGDASSLISSFSSQMNKNRFHDNGKDNNKAHESVDGRNRPESASVGGAIGGTAISNGTERGNSDDNRPKVEVGSHDDNKSLSSDGRHYSPYIHPAVVRRMWMESQAVASSASFTKHPVSPCTANHVNVSPLNQQHSKGRNTLSSVESSFSAASSHATSAALAFLESIKKSFGESIL